MYLTRAAFYTSSFTPLVNLQLGYYSSCSLYNTQQTVSCILTKKLQPAYCYRTYRYCSRLTACPHVSILGTVLMYCTYSPHVLKASCKMQLQMHFICHINYCILVSHNMPLPVACSPQITQPFAV
jgi:hypothetical protein